VFLVYVLTPHVLSEWMVEVCGKYLCGVYVLRLSWWMLLTLGGILYYTLLLLYIILYYTLIIYYTYTILLLLLYILYTILISSSHLSSIPLSHLSHSSSHSFYTCRYLHILIYILSTSIPSSNNSTPHVLSEWMVEVCGGEVYRFCLSLCFELVGVGCYYIIL
jgi:hypothetical protein